MEGVIVRGSKTKILNIMDEQYKDFSKFKELFFTILAQFDCYKVEDFTEADLRKLQYFAIRNANAYRICVGDSVYSILRHNAFRLLSR